MPSGKSYSCAGVIIGRSLGRQSERIAAKGGDQRDRGKKRDESLRRTRAVDRSEQERGNARSGSWFFFLFSFVENTELGFFYSLSLSLSPPLRVAAWPCVSSESRERLFFYVLVRTSAEAEVHGGRARHTCVSRRVISSEYSHVRGRLSSSSRQSEPIIREARFRYDIHGVNRDRAPSFERVT